MVDLDQFHKGESIPHDEIKTELASHYQLPESFHLCMRSASS